MSGLTDSIYASMPIWAQQAAVAAYGWWWFRRRFGSHFHRLVDEFKSREHWGAEQFRNYQNAHLKKIFSAAWRSPYYRRVFAEAGVSADMQAFEALSRVPPLEKEVLR